MFKKLVLKLFILGAACVVKARGIISRAISDEDTSSDEQLIAIASAVFSRFKVQQPSEVLFLKLRPDLSNRRLPEFLRYPEGVIETYVERGLCDNSARMLKFLLRQKGYESAQWNMVTDNFAHSALRVSTPNGDVLVDSFYGLIAYNHQDQKLLSPAELRDQLIARKNFEEVFLPLGENKERAFYEDFTSVRMARQGEQLEIEALLPEVSADPVILGNVDGDAVDVKSAAAMHNMSPFWHYAGHKYDRSWVRSLRATQNVRLEMTLLSDVEKGIITAVPEPSIAKNKMIWDLKAGDEIKFYDGKAKISWRRLNSFIGVDQIAIYPN